MCKICMQIENKYILIIITQFDNYLHHLLTLLFKVRLMFYPRMATVLIILKAGFLNISVPVFVII